MSQLIAVLLTLAAIRAGVTRMLTTAVSMLGKRTNVLDYGHEGRAFVLTPIYSDGAPSWRTTEDKGSMRDAIIRVYVLAIGEDEFHVGFGVKVHGAPADRKVDLVKGLSRAKAEVLITSTVHDLATGNFTGHLSSQVPNVKSMRVRYVERPDQQATASASKVSTLTDDATQAMEARLKAAEAAENVKPADKPAKG